MSLTVLVVNGNRHLINEDSKASDDTCQTIIEGYGADAIVEFDEVKLADVKPKSLKELINESN